MQIKTIKNIIFDLGNVILNIDPDLTVKAMKNLGFKEFNKSYSLLNQSNLFDSLEKGIILPEQFHAEINLFLDKKVTPDQINKAWGAMLLDFPEKRIRLIQKLNKRYRVFLLSNTNSIHYHQYSDDFMNRFGFELNSLFEKAYYSFDMKLRKPDTDIFEFVIQDGGLNPQETLFIDDSKANIDTAKKIGLETLWIDISKDDDIVTKLHGF